MRSDGVTPFSKLLLLNPRPVICVTLSRVLTEGARGDPEALRSPVMMGFTRGHLEGVQGTWPTRPGSSSRNRPAHRATQGMRISLLLTVSRPQVEQGQEGPGACAATGGSSKPPRPRWGPSRGGELSPGGVSGSWRKQHRTDCFRKQKSHRLGHALSVVGLRSPARPPSVLALSRPLQVLSHSQAPGLAALCLHLSLARAQRGAQEVS